MNELLRFMVSILSPVPVRGQLTPVDSAVPSLHWDVGRRAAHASGARAETVGTVQ